MTLSHLFELTITNPLWWLASHVLLVSGFGLCVFLIARVFREHRAAPVTLAWLLAIILIPYIGVPAYLIFGGRKLRGVLVRKPALFPANRPNPHADSMVTSIERVLTTAGMPPAREHNHVDFLADGQAAYRSLVSTHNSSVSLVHRRWVLP